MFLGIKKVEWVKTAMTLTMVGASVSVHSVHAALESKVSAEDQAFVDKGEIELQTLMLLEAAEQKQQPVFSQADEDLVQVAGDGWFFFGYGGQEAAQGSRGASHRADAGRGGRCRTFSGVASYYNRGKRTANGESFNPRGKTAAHPHLPFNTWVKVTNPKTGRSVSVRINDRGPFVGGRILDLAEGAAKSIGMQSTSRVICEVCGS
jgi:rare lipoprotein A